MASSKFEIEEHVAVISEKENGWKKELNLVSWYGNEAKYEVREWNEDRTKMGKGVSLSKDDLRSLRDILNGLEVLDDE